MKFHFDEFRIRIIQKRTAFKRWLCKLLKSWLGKIDEIELKKCIIGETITMEIAKFVPDDGAWHHVAMTIDYYFKQNDGKKTKKETRGIYVDGELKAKERGECSEC